MEVEYRTLADRMKEYEQATEMRLDNSRPYLMRLDGHTFSTFTHGFRKPFDPHLAQAMVATTVDLQGYFHPPSAYTQSDEITLIFPAVSQGQGQEQEATESQGQFNLRVLKMCTLASAFCSVRFNHHLAERGRLDGCEVCAAKAATMTAHFDCRAFNLPDEREALCNLVWRCKDAQRNSKTAFGRKFFSTKQISGLTSDQVVAKVEAEKGVKFDEVLGGHYKWGTVVKRWMQPKQTVNPKGETVNFVRPVPRYLSRLIRFDEELVRLLQAKNANDPGFEAWAGSFNEAPDLSVSI